jgi:aryl-alcohol dehydrogenase-like predicted oxidoreductase
MPLLQGVLTGKYETADDVPDFRTRTRHFSGDRPQSRHGGPGAEAELFQVVDAVQAIAADLGEPMANVALAWVMAKPGVTSVITGARTPDQVARNVAAASLTLTQETIALLDAATDDLKQKLGPNADYWQIGENSRVR